MYRTLAWFGMVGSSLIDGSPVQAQDRKPQDRSKMTISIGAGAAIVPDYEGSNETRILPFPAMDIAWDRFRLRGGSLTVAGVRTEAITIGAIASFRQGRRESRNPALFKVGNVADAVDIGGFADVSLGQVHIGASVTEDLVGDGGMLATGSLSSPRRIGKRLLVIPQVQATWADAHYMRLNFGIDEKQSLGSRYARYRPSSGLKDIGAGLTANYRLTDHWSLLASAGYKRLLDKAGRSPIVDGPGSRNQMTGFGGITYRF